MFTVYANKPNRRATIHRDDCNQLYKNGGKSKRHPDNAHYRTGFTAIQAARDYIALIEWVRGDRISECSFCFRVIIGVA